MDITLLIQVMLVAAATAIAFWKGRWHLLESGFKQAIHSFQTLWLRVLLGLTLGGLIQVLIPRELIAQWLGPDSGMKGILIGSYLGMFVTSGPQVRMPIIASIYAAGAAVGPVIAITISSALLGVTSLCAWQIPFLGVKIPLSRYIACLFITPIAALAGSALYHLFNPL